VEVGPNRSARLREGPWQGCNRDLPGSRSRDSTRSLLWAAHPGFAGRSVRLGGVGLKDPLRSARRWGRRLIRRAEPAEMPRERRTPVPAAAPPGFCFRVRFRLGVTAHIAAADDEPVLAVEEEHGERVVVRARERGTALNDARDLVLVGARYVTAEAAEQAAARWVPRLQVALARLHLGADFGLRAPRSGITKHGLRMFEQQVGRRVIHDAEGRVVVYECDPPPACVALGPVTAVVGKPADRLVKLMRAAADLDVALDEREQLAYDLYSASFFEHNADTRFLTLMMALETLIEQSPRSEAAVGHLTELIDQTRASGMPAAEVASLVRSLEELAARESVGSAGRRLAGKLGDTEYVPGESPPKFFTRCYALRSALVHGEYPRPERGEVSSRAAALESFVGDLLGLPLLEH
jgi:hypothetical protein